LEKQSHLLEIPGCRKWVGGPASRVWVNKWEKCTKEIMTRVRYKGKNVVDRKKVNEIN